MTLEEFNEILNRILPPVVGGAVRPTNPIPTDLPFSTEFPQLLQTDINLADHENAFLRLILSDLALLKILSDNTETTVDDLKIFSQLKIDNILIQALTQTDTITFTSGKHILLTPDIATQTVNIALDGELGIHLLNRGIAYKKGDIADSPDLPSWARLECMVAGTTDSKPINY